MKFKPTKEGAKILNYAKNRNENLLINAYAGCGKTTMLIEVSKTLPKHKRRLFLAFNRHIKEELQAKLPEDVKCMTTYGLGLSGIKKIYGDSITFDEFKVDKTLQKKSKTWKLETEFKNQQEIDQYLNRIKKMVDLCRLSLTLNPEYFGFVANKYEVPLTKKKDFNRIAKILDLITQNKKTYDYVDMIYMPATDSKIWMYPYDYILVDEIQDLNRCQIRLIEKSLKKKKKSKTYDGRLISVGDRFQNIYGFNGTGETSFDWFKGFQKTKVLPLSVSFRCSKNVIENAQKIVPEIKALENAPDGDVRDGNVLEEAKSGDFILCRTTRPLVVLFFKFLLKQKKATIKGSDIGIKLVDLIGKNKTIDELIDHWTHHMKTFREDLKKEGILDPRNHSGYSTLNDSVETLLFMARLSDGINDLKNKIKQIFTDQIEGIVLSTVHKIKGLESKRVFIVRPDLLPMKINTRGWQYQQEKNLEYVAYTRAIEELIFDREWSDEKIT